MRGLLTSDPGFAEALVGAWLVSMRGVMLFSIGFTFSSIGDLLAHWSFTFDRLGFLLFAIGVAQLVGVGTEYHRARGMIAFAGCATAAIIGLAYAVEHDVTATRFGFTLAYTWWSLATSELLIGLRIFFNLGAQHAADAINGGRKDGDSSGGPHDPG